jgi:hypothetical protein
VTVDDFTRAYIAAALWSSSDDDDEPLDARFDELDIDAATMDCMKADCLAFQDSAKHEIARDASGAGHDFWLTRNGHGAGFWDGDWPEPAGDILTKRAKAFGEYSLYVGDDGKIYGMGGS